MTLYAGTSGFSYKEWKGPFYPEDLPAKKMLAHYAERLPTVEINNTFYRMPKASVLEGWRDQVPAGFRFAVKASRRISHFKRLADCDEEVSYLFDVLTALESKLGVVLFQLPPHFRIDLPRLVTFLELLPDAVPCAFEFRHPSWDDESVDVALAERGVARVITDTEGEAVPELGASIDWCYLRLRAAAYDDALLGQWSNALQRFDRKYVFFKHEDEGAGPQFALQLLGLDGS